jgi:hypothetical protein
MCSVSSPGQGEDGANIKKLLQTAGIPEEALTAPPPEESTINFFLNVFKFIVC